MFKTNRVTFSYTECDNIEELNQDDRELLLSADEAAGNAYAPYSDFRVGAALRLRSGTIVTGVNVENAAFPSGICAERSAIAGASSMYPGDVPVALAITAYTSSGLSNETVSPCGNCRQVIAEEESRHGRSIRIILRGRNKIRIIEKGEDLLPLVFNKETMKITHR